MIKLTFGSFLVICIAMSGARADDWKARPVGRCKATVVGTPHHWVLSAPANSFVHLLFPDDGHRIVWRVNAGDSPLLIVGAVQDKPEVTSCEPAGPSMVDCQEVECQGWAAPEQ